MVDSTSEEKVYLQVPRLNDVTGYVHYTASENFVAFMQNAKNVRTFGSTTGGSDGSPWSYTVMNGVTVEISSWQERFTTTHLPIEGIGITPDVDVPITYEDLVSQVSAERDGENPILVDPVVEAAIAWIDSSD